MNRENNLRVAEQKAELLFKEIENSGMIKAGISEKELNSFIYQTAHKLLGIKKYWHKRIVRSGKNTLFPYKENPQDLIIQNDDILFFDFGPVFEDWEADLGKTYVIGNDPKKLKLKEDTEMLWNLGKVYFVKNPNLTAAAFFNHTVELAEKNDWQFGGEHCGHLIGNFPHEKIEGESKLNYIHPENHTLMNTVGLSGLPKHWIYEIHLVDRELEIGGFYEKLLTID